MFSVVVVFRTFVLVLLLFFLVSDDFFNHFSVSLYHSLHVLVVLQYCLGFDDFLLVRILVCLQGDLSNILVFDSVWAKGFLVQIVHRSLINLVLANLNRF